MAAECCYVHKKRNLLARVPASLQYHAVSYEEAMFLRQKFERKWGKSLPAAVKVLQEDWEQTTTFLAYPPSQHKALRTTDIIERLFEEFRHRKKHQGMAHR
jgi:transposase-like protein